MSQQTEQSYFRRLLCFLFYRHQLRLIGSDCGGSWGGTNFYRCRNCGFIYSEFQLNSETMVITND